MPEIELNAEQIGKQNEDGSIAEWPARDMDGRPYERVNLTIRYLPGRQFVIIPPGKDAADLTFKLAAPKPSAPAKPGKAEDKL